MSKITQRNTPPPEIGTYHGGLINYRCISRGYLLVSPHIRVVRERLSVMQRQARLPEFFDEIAKNTNSQFDYARIPFPRQFKFRLILAL